ncbi:MAG TPA: YIP1 family protein [Pyrinomonadaceae bacterium]
MSDPNSGFHAPPAPTIQPEPVAPQPTKLRPIAIALFVVGLVVFIVGIAKILPGGIVTGLVLACWGILLFAFSFIRPPQITGVEPPMSALQKITGIFYEPSRVFSNLRVHPYWLTAFLVVGILNVVYTAAFVQRLTPERLVEYTMDRLAQSPIKPPPEQMERMKEEGLRQAKQPIQRIQTAVKSLVGIFFLGSLVAALYLLGIMMFGGRINFWQALAVYFYATLPVVVIQKLVSLLILYIKSPEDIHPILGQESLLQDNLGVLFDPAEHPVLFVAASVIGVLSFYGLWLRAKGLQYGGEKVSSTAAWGAALMVWILWVIFGLTIAAIFPSFFS